MGKNGDVAEMGIWEGKRLVSGGTGVVGMRGAALCECGEGTRVVGIPEQALEEWIWRAGVVDVRAGVVVIRGAGGQIKALSAHHMLAFK